ncbi:MAG: hypothetical protein CMJ83_12810 [Planctomycetes bacterium]|nr:hypothetical protein [Planctomycetota bacterium]
MSRIRIQRLISDEQDLQAFIEKGWSRWVDVLEREGQPPSTYLVSLKVPGVEALARGRRLREDRGRRGPFVIRHEHRVRLTLPREYPFRPPQVTFTEKHLHPNIYPNGRLCWGIADEASWWRGGDGLGTLIERLLYILVGLPECTNPRSPANADAVDPYVKNADLFPLARLDAQQPSDPDGLRFREITP